MELAILMIVLIPTILYTMYLEDLLYYQFDLQETVVSSAWDPAHYDYRLRTSDFVSKEVTSAAKQTYEDHSSAWNSYENPDYDSSPIHHQAMTAHQCWEALGGQRVQCEINEQVGLVVDSRFAQRNHGGLASCSAILGVQNYFLPESFLGWFGKVGITGDGKQSIKRHTAGQSEIHSEAANDPFLYPKMTFGVVHDPWALYWTHPDKAKRAHQDINPDNHPAEIGTEFSEWVQIPYHAHNDLIFEAKMFADEAINAEILSDRVRKDGKKGDLLSTPAMAWKKDPERLFKKDHTASAWTDGRQQQTYQRRREGSNGYMGVKVGTW